MLNTTTAPSLRELQSWLSKIITHPRGTEFALQAKSFEPSELLSIVDAVPLSRVERLDIYSEGYFARLLENLGNDFENLVRVLTAYFDENAFRKIISAYLESHPSQTRTVGDLGHALPDFLRSYEPVQQFPFLAEVAELDWRATRALYIDTLSSFDPATVASLSEEEWTHLKFQLDPTVQWFKVTHSIAQIWNESEISTEMIEPEPGQILVHRFQDYVYAQAISPSQLQVLKLMQASKTLGEICDSLESGDAENVMSWFGEWIGNGVIKRAALAI